MPNHITRPLESRAIFGTQSYTAQNKGYIFRDQSSSSRVDRLKRQAQTAYDRSQPTNGLVVKRDDVNSRLDALNRTRAGGYVPPPKARGGVSEVSAAIVAGKKHP
jgi:hypothetical protein